MSRRGGSLAADSGAALPRPSRPRGPRTGRGRPVGRAGVGEALLVWGLFGFQATATLVTYSRLPPESLYNVDDAGTLSGGLGRTLVLLNYPVALAAVAIAALVGGPRGLVGTAIGLCAVTALPGVVDQGDLDARWINAVPAVGVAVALALTVAAARRGAALAPRARGDRVRVALSVTLVLIALPWLAAELGFHLPGDVFLGEEVPATRDPGLAAVHLGFHHGNGGVFLALSALALSRPPASRLLRAYLSLMLAYGGVNAIQDAWNEQLWKRGWVDGHFPSVIRPDLSLGWLAVAAAAVIVYAAWFRPERRR